MLKLIRDRVAEKTDKEQLIALTEPEIGATLLQEAINEIAFLLDDTKEQTAIVELLELVYTLGRRAGIAEEELDRRRLHIRQRLGGYDRMACIHTATAKGVMPLITLESLLSRD